MAFKLDRSTLELAVCSGPSGWHKYFTSSGALPGADDRNFRSTLFMSKHLYKPLSKPIHAATTESPVSRSSLTVCQSSFRLSIAEVVRNVVRRRSLVRAVRRCDSWFRVQRGRVLQPRSQSAMADCTAPCLTPTSWPMHLWNVVAMRSSRHVVAALIQRSTLPMTPRTPHPSKFRYVTSLYCIVDANGCRFTK